MKKYEITVAQVFPQGVTHGEYSKILIESKIAKEIIKILEYNHLVQYTIDKDKVIATVTIGIEEFKV